METTAQVKQAVKEALAEKAISDLSDKMIALSTQMAEGFAKVHTRQDIANGKVATNTMDIIKLKEKNNYDKIVWLALTTLIGIVVYLITKS